MKTLFSEIGHIGKYDFNYDVVRVTFFVWKFNDEYGLLSDSINELELKLTMMGV